MFMINKVPRSWFKEPNFLNAFSILLEDIRFSSSWYINYFTLFCIRRLIFVVIAFWLSLASMQRLSIHYINLFMLIYVNTKPFKAKFLN